MPRYSRSRQRGMDADEERIVLKRLLEHRLDMQVSRGPRYVMSQPGGDEDDRLMLGHPLDGLDRVKV
jgi:hypothetical protein